MVVGHVLETLAYLKSHHLVLSTAESCTAGSMVALLESGPKSCARAPFTA